jgi:hypothetical protein
MRHTSRRRQQLHVRVQKLVNEYVFRSRKDIGTSQSSSYHYRFVYIRSHFQIPAKRLGIMIENFCNFSQSLLENGGGITTISCHILSIVLLTNPLRGMGKSSG